MTHASPLPPEQWYASLATFCASAAALITEPGGRVLLVKPNYRPGWNLPGGVLEAAEAPHEGCAREVAEELGLTVTPGRLLVVDWCPPTEIRRGWFGFVFDCGVLADPGPIVLQRAELDDYEFVPPGEAATRLPQRTARRLQAALRVHGGPSVAYLADGVPVGGFPIDGAPIGSAPTGGVPVGPAGPTGGAG